MRYNVFVMDTREPERLQMVDEQLGRRDIVDQRVLAAMRRVPRHLFVPPQLSGDAYLDMPLPIGEGQTISQPYIVALTAQALALGPSDKVLEIGTGSGYAAAVLAELAGEVLSIERNSVLAARARERLHSLGYANVRVLEGDGTVGYAQEAPYQAISVTASGPRVPPSLVAQLAPGGRLLIPVGANDWVQELVLVRKLADEQVLRESLGSVRFVPLIGKEGWAEPLLN